MVNSAAAVFGFCLLATSLLQGEKLKKKIFIYFYFIRKKFIEKFKANKNTKIKKEKNSKVFI